MHFLSVIKYSTHDTLSPLQTYTCSQIYRKVDFGRAKSFKDSNVNNKLFFTKFFRKFHNSLEVLKHDSVVTSYNPLTQQCVFPWYYMVKIRQKITFIAHYHCVQVKRLFFILIKHKKMICIQYFCLDIVQVIYHLLCGATYSNQAYYCVLSSSISYPKSFNVVLC